MSEATSASDLLPLRTDAVTAYLLTFQPI